MRLLSTIRDFFSAPILHTQQAAFTIEQEAARQQRDRITRIKNAWDIYAGKAAKPLKVDITRPDDNTIVNICRVIVDKGADFLFGKPVSFDVKGEHETEEEWLQQAWLENGRDLLLHDIAVNGAVAGDTFVRIAKDPGRDYPRLINIDPASVYALWDTDDIERVVEYRIEWVGIDPQQGRAVARRQTITRNTPLTWAITDYISPNDAREWAQIGQEIWPYSWCPVFKTKNLPAPNEFYGTPDLTDDIIHMNDRANFIASNTTKIIRHHAHPKTWGRGFNAAQMSVAPDEVTVIQADGGTLQNLEMQTDLQSSLNWYKYLVSGLHTIARVPEVATGRVESLGQLSGVALEILYAPIVEKTRTKRMLYGNMLNAINRAMLEMGGFGADHECVCHWSDPWPTDDLTQTQIAIMYQSLGVSNRTIHGLLGFDYEREKRQAEADGDVKEDAPLKGNDDAPGTRMGDLRPSRVPRKQFTETD